MNLFYFLLEFEYFVGFEFRLGNYDKNKYFLPLVFSIVTSHLKIDIQVPRINHLRMDLIL